jgi:hypothetical protein
MHTLFGEEVHEELRKHCAAHCGTMARPGEAEAGERSDGCLSFRASIGGLRLEMSDFCTCSSPIWIFYKNQEIGVAGIVTNIESRSEQKWETTLACLP